MSLWLRRHLLCTQATAASVLECRRENVKEAHRATETLVARSPSLAVPLGQSTDETCVLCESRPINVSSCRIRFLRWGHTAVTSREVTLELAMEKSGSSSSSEFEEELENACAVLVANTVARKKRVWVHQINLKRKEKGEFYHLVKELKEHPSRYEMYFRMTKEEFQFLHDLIKEDIITKNTQLREAITTEEKLAVCLRGIVYTPVPDEHEAADSVEMGRGENDVSIGIYGFWRLTLYPKTTEVDRMIVFGQCDMWPKPPPLPDCQWTAVLVEMELVEAGELKLQVAVEMVLMEAVSEVTSLSWLVESRGKLSGRQLESFPSREYHKLDHLKLPRAVLRDPIWGLELSRGHQILFMDAKEDSTASYYPFGLYVLTLMCNGRVKHILSEVKEGFGNQINLCRDRGLNPGPLHRIRGGPSIIGTTTASSTTKFMMCLMT
uniref:Uncharacterized protein n=1 Tax=Timema tahoe TaxID=61484 RepID=A0A7R9ICK3_9NEOP|nr:unnamed protein product [Timema tahoe]